jgi:hypothetical protein
MISGTAIKINPKIYFQKQNEHYNEAIDSIIDDIFQTNRIVNSEYILVGDYVLEQVKLFTPFSEIEKALKTYNNEIKSEIIPNTAKVGKPYENLVAHLMLNGGFDTYVIAGGMGTGKTSACGFIVELLTKKLGKKGNFIINIKFDFNGPYDGTDDEIVAQFKRELYNKLSLEVEEYFRENIESLEKFCSALNHTTEKKEYVEFKNFKDYKETCWIEGTITDEEKVNKFIEFLDRHEDKINALMKSVYFIAHKLTGNTVILVFDNIDVLFPNCQRRILINVFKYNIIAKVRCFMPLRRATFKRTLREIQKDEYSKAAFNFGYIHHHGAEPLKVVLDRVNKFLSDPSRYKVIDSLPPVYKEHIISRFESYKTFLEKDNPFSRFFTFICGRSSRVALLLSKRFFVNNVIEYSNHNFHFDQGIKAFMVTDNPSYLFDNTNEQEIANVLCCNVYSDFSFIPYLILSSIAVAKDIQHYEIKHIYSTVKNSIKYNLSDQEFLDILNHILSVRRPLLWSDDKSYYDLSTNLTQNANTLQFTEVGRGYLDIINHNTQYLQECLMSIRWEHDYVPQQFDSFKLGERFAFLRKCILDIFQKEKKYITYPSNIKPLSTLLFTTIGNYYQFILNRNELLLKTQHDEILSWKSLRTDLYNEYSFDFYSEEKISNFLERYELE